MCMCVMYVFKCVCVYVFMRSLFPSFPFSVSVDYRGNQKPGGGWGLHEIRSIAVIEPRQTGVTFAGTSGKRQLIVILREKKNIRFVKKPLTNFSG